jgi:hypothetical protein
MVITHNLGSYLSSQEPQSAWLQTVVAMLGEGLEVGTLLLTLTLAIFVILVFAVRAVAIYRKLPVPVHVLDMAKPLDFRALMLVTAALLAPLIAQEFLPVRGADLSSTLLATYTLELPIVLLLWIALHIFYTVRARRKRS